MAELTASTASAIIARPAETGLLCSEDGILPTRETTVARVALLAVERAVCAVA